MIVSASVRKKGKLRLVLTVLGILLAVPMIGAGILFATFDADAWRTDIAQLLSDKLGRKLTLNGPMRLGMEGGGLALEINDATLANPEWASRPEMAKIGKLALAVKLIPLLHKQLDVAQIIIEDADIQLESQGRHKNWEFAVLRPHTARRAAPMQPQGEITPAAAPESAPIALNIKEFKLKNVRLAMHDDTNGKAQEVKINKLSLDAAGKTALQAEGEFAQQAFTVTLDGAPWQELMTGRNWPFTIAAGFGGNDFAGQGTAGAMATQVDFTEFTLKSAAGSTIDGKVRIALLGRPRINGNIHIDKMQPPAGDQAQAVPSAASGNTSRQESGQNFIFNDQKIDMSELSAADANLHIVIDSITAGDLKLDNLQTDLRLSGGRLELRPFAVNVAGSPVNGRMMLDARPEPAQLEVTLTGQQMDLNPLLQSLGALGVTLGKSDFALDVNSTGGSARNFASNLNGTVKFELASGVLPLALLKLVANDGLQAFLPGVDKIDDLRLSCGSVRFTAQNGVLSSKGILFESNLATIAGAGTVDLRQETINLKFKPQPKDASLGQLTPSLRLAGALTKPSVRLDVAGAAVDIAGSFLGAPIPLGGDNLQVPVVNAGAAGNACTDALDHPVYAATAAPPNSAAGKAAEKGRAFVQDKTKGLVEKLDKALGGENSPLKGLLGQ